MGEPHLFCDLGWVKSKARWCIGGVNISCQKLKQIWVMSLDFIYKCQRKWMRNEYYAILHCQKWKVGDIWRNKDFREANIGKNAAKCYKRKTSMNSWISGLNGPTLEKIVCEKPLGGCFGKVKRQKDGNSDISRDGWSPCGGDPAGECSWTDQPTRQEKGIHRSHQLFRLVSSLFSQQALDTRKF